MPKSGWEGYYFQNTHFQRLEVQFSETMVSIWDLVLGNVEISSAPPKYYSADRIDSYQRQGRGELLKSAEIKQVFLGVLFHYYFYF